MADMAGYYWSLRDFATYILAASFSGDRYQARKGEYITALAAERERVRQATGIGR